jgi:hypothetical protein
MASFSIAEIGHQKYGYRGVVMDYYKRFLLKHDSDLQFILSKTGIKKITRSPGMALFARMNCPEE